LWGDWREYLNLEEREEEENGESRMCVEEME
jgi:hypothetical protein